MPEQDSNFIVIKNDLQYIKNDIANIRASLEDKYVTKDQFQPVKSIVYGLVGTTLVSVLGAIVALVIRT